MKVPGWRLAARGWRRRAVAVNGMSPGRPAHRGLRLAAALAVVACAVLAAQQAPPAGQQPPPVFRAATTLVEVDAIVRDKAGRFVDDLVAADFEVLEDGKPQAIEGFYLVRGSAVVPAAAPSPEPGAAAAAAPSVQRVFVLVFDVEHASPGAVDRARKAALKFLDANFGQGDLGGIVAGGTMANGRLTSDASELAAAVKAVKPTGDERSRQLELREWPRLADALEAHLIERGDAEATNRAVQRACIDDPEACRRYPIEQVLNEKARRVMVDIRGAAMRTMRTLSALSSGLARAPGRKTVVLLSDGFFAEDSWGSLRQVTDLAARSATRFYALDTRGLNRGSASSDILDAGPRAPVNPAGEAAGQDFLADAPNSLAVDTGGLAIRNENDFAKALNEIAADTSTYYVLAYRPADATPDGRFRPLSVRVRRAGVAVRSRKGYVASPAGTPAPSRAAETPPGPEPAPAPEAAPAPAPPEAAPVSPAGTPSPLKPAGTPALLVEGAGSAPSVRLRP
ncbi:MAG: VWFA-related Acidobacterial domain protein, partial [Acidobacteria bacterium]|nr:VWFA-related Acidobacterial domain protein [Acidobacteriota bacterium]